MEKRKIVLLDIFRYICYITNRTKNVLFPRKLSEDVFYMI